MHILDHEWERTLVSNHSRFESVVFFQLEPCPKIPTTLVINSELTNATGVYLHTLHIDMRDMPASFNILTAHLVGPKGNFPTESIKICGFKTNMIIANITNGNLYSDSSELSKLHFTKKYHENGEFLADHCFPEHGYYAYVIGGKYPAVGRTPKRIIIFNGNNIMNLNSRVFGVFDMPEGHTKYIIKVSSKMRGIAVISYKDGNSTTTVNNSRVVFQRFDYPSPTITTNAAGKFNCTLKISEPKNIFGGSTNDIPDDVAANFSVDVHRWTAFHANWSHRVPATIDRKKELEHINLEQMLDISGPLFSADLRLHRNATGAKQAIRLLPRYQSELFFADEFGKSDFLDIQYISDQAILVVCDGAIKLLTVMNDESPEEYQKVKLLPNTTLNIINLDSMTAAYPNYRSKYLNSVKFNFTNRDNQLLEDMVNFGLLYQMSSDATDVLDCLVLVLAHVNVSDNRIYLNPIQPFVSLMELKSKNVDIEQSQMLVTNVSTNKYEKRLFWAFLSQNRTVLESHGTAIYVWKHLGKAYVNESAPLYFNLTLDRYNMRNPYFRVEQFHLTYYLNSSDSEKFFMHVLSSDALMLMSMCPDGLSQTIRFFNYNLGQLGDMVSAFSCSVQAHKCVLSLKGGSIAVLNMTNESKLWKLTDINQKFLIPSKYAFKEILLGRDIMLGYNFDYEDYLFFYNKISDGQGLQYPHITLRKEYGYRHKVRYIPGEEERILITNGNSMGQVLSLCNLTLLINNSQTTKHEISKIGLALNLLGESEQYVNSTQLLNPPFLYVGERIDTREDNTKPIVILLVSAALLLFGACFNTVFYKLRIQDMALEKKLEPSKSSELSLASSKESTLITRNDSFVHSPTKPPVDDWARRTVEAARVMSIRAKHKTYFSSTLL